MRKIINEMFGREIIRWREYTRKAKCAYIYFALSFVLMALGVCSDSALMAIVCVGNFVVASMVAICNIPDFYAEE